MVNIILGSPIDNPNSAVETHSNVSVRIVDENLVSAAPFNQIPFLRDGSEFVFILSMNLSMNMSFMGVPGIYRGKEGSKE